MNQIDASDVIAGVGLLLLAFGLYLAWAPLAPIVAGTVLLAIGVAYGYRGNR